MQGLGVTFEKLERDANKVAAKARKADKRKKQLRIKLQEAQEKQRITEERKKAAERLREEKRRLIEEKKHNAERLREERKLMAEEEKASQLGKRRGKRASSVLNECDGNSQMCPSLKKGRTLPPRFSADYRTPYLTPEDMALKLDIVPNDGHSEDEEVYRNYVYPNPEASQPGW